MKTNLLRAYALLIVVASLSAGAIHGPEAGALCAVMLATALSVSLRGNLTLLRSTVDISSPNTASSLSAQAANSVRKLWKKGLDMFEQNTDFFSEFEGNSPRSVIRVENGTADGRGQKITFTSAAGFYRKPHHGDEMFLNPSDFEKLQINDYDMVVDWLRNGVRYNKRMEEYMGMRGEIASGFNEEMGKWLGRTKTHLLFMMFLHKVADSSLSVINGKTIDQLGGGDTVDYDAVQTLATQIKRLGGVPAIGGRNRENGKAIFRNFLVATTDALDSLEKDPTYKGYLRDGDVRGNMNYLFKEGFKDIKGQIIKEYNPIDHDGLGPIGSPLNPKAELGVAITAGTGAFDIKGGGSAAAAAETDYEFFRDFPNFAYKFCEGDQLTAGTDPFYVLIVNPPDGTATANKVGFYKCVTNDGVKLTVTERLAPSAAGSSVNKTTVGSVTWNSGKFEGIVTTEHPEGAMIYLANAKGQPYGYSLYLGASAAYRGYGIYRGHRSQQIHEGGFVTDVFITTVLGQEPRRDVRDRTPGVIRLAHSINYAGTPIPTDL
jgi:hypothetical protein